MTDQKSDPAAPDGSAKDGGPAFASLRDRLVAARPGAVVIAAERVGLIRFDLPVRGRRRRIQAAPFAIEDRLSEPPASLHCALHPGIRPPEALAAVVRHDAMPDRPAAPVLVETMAVPAPPARDGRTAWAAWREGPRVVVRVSDGSGFAARSDQLAILWRIAGRPALTSLAGPLPDPLEAEDLSHAPPPPDAADLAFDLRQGALSADARDWPTVARIAAAAVVAGLVLHLGIAALDRAALARIAAADRAEVEIRLAERLPGASLGMGVPALVERLAPAPAAPSGSAFLPLLGASAAALLGDAPDLDVQRLSWDAASGDLVMDVTAASLEDLQRIERRLSERGLAVSSGAATAGDGTARADLRIGAAP
ncbi:type II secretion system protein GspL [Palleronia rufa]|uniref:type II secretion system protein GspL n=1 Tax=Palleronia rufa TaxID=1530186 RepID=UPI00055D21C6|nr:type II secretion system protein GspL [Palleronia rufa]